MFDLATILKIVQGAGSLADVADNLFDQIVGTFGDDDQERLRAAYADARKKSDQAHGDVQAKLARAQGR
jgi:uncharacterized protein YutD